ncbi:MAG: DUF835 domain-containing protein [Candidatus Thermoplasmatota archaeon]
MVAYLSALSALFLSLLVLIAIVRQKTHKVFQKHVLLFATLLLMCAMVSNVLITFYITNPGQTDQNALKEGIVLSKRVQATFDYAFSMTIGAFIVVATTPSITTRRDFLKYMTEEFPNSYVFYLFIMAMAVIAIYISPVTVVSTYPTVIQFEPYFLFINGVAVGTLTLYAPYRFTNHMRKTNPGRDVRRDTYFVIMGISGFAIGELLFEIVLPNFAIDLRAPGFVVEMALIGLIAFAIREKSFLQDLVVPAAEAQAMTKPTYRLERSRTYAILERDGQQGFEIFKDLVTHGAQGLCITRRSPKAVMQDYGLERTPILWLSRVATEKNSVRPSPPEKVALAVEHFISLGENAVVLLDGFEYLVAHNDFSSVLALLHDLNEVVALHDAILLIPIDPSTFQDREFAFVRRETTLLGPLAEEYNEAAAIHA